MAIKWKFNPFTSKLDATQDPLEAITHADLSDMPDVAGTNTDHDARYLQTETDPIVGAITGIVKANGAGVISAAAVDTDYLSPSSSITTLSDVVTPTPTKNDHLIFNGTNWVNAPDGTTFTFSLSAFDDGLTTGILAGSGVWKAAEAINFTASYDNGPPTTANIQQSVNGAAFATINAMDGPAYTTGNNTAAINYPTVDQYLRYQLVASDGVDGNTVQAASLYFYNYIYYGASTTGSGFSEANVEALTGTVSSSYTTSRSINAGASNYVVWAYPSRYTSIHATGALFNSVVMPFTAPETVELTNTAGLTENYKVFASTVANLGNSTLQLSTSSQIINPFYYGGSTLNTGWSEAQIKALTDVENGVQNDTTTTFNTVTLAANEYFVFAYPSRLTDPTNWFDNGTGFPLSLKAGGPETVSITNVNGYSENYDVWVSNQILGPGNFQLRTT